MIAELGANVNFNQRHPYLPVIEENNQQTIPVDIIACPNDISATYFANQELSILIVP